MTPLAIDLFCGLGGWTEGLLAERYWVVGFDIERHEYWMPEITDESNGSKETKPVEKRGWTQGCAVSLGMEGAAAKPRTQLVKYPAQLVLQDVMTLHGKQFKDAALIVASPPCQEYSYMAMPWSRAKAIAAEYRSGLRDVKKLTALFDACFRIQREAIKAAGHFIPLVVENVRGACPWVGRSRWNFGSYHLWGDVPALMPMTRRNVIGEGMKAGDRNKSRAAGNGGHTWSSGWDETAGQKVPGFRFDGSGGSFQTASVNGIKNSRNRWSDGQGNLSATIGSHSKARKAASAAIAKIPLQLARHIAKVYFPQESRRCT